MASKKERAFSHVEHGFPAFVEADSEVLILGSFPSVKSREQAFFYGHPQNRFWPMMSAVFGEEAGRSIEEKKRFLKKYRVALYDVIESCDIVGSSDASIRNVVPADIESLLRGTQIRLILLNGKKAGSLYEKHLLPVLGNSIPYVVMPSTSPANAAAKFLELVAAYKAALNR